MMAFTIGMKVLCIGGGMDEPDPSINRPIRGSIYTIRTIKPSSRWLGEICIRVNEIHNTPRHYSNGFSEISFRGIRFRPLVERKQEVSFTTGADPQSDKWDNRRPVEVHTFDEAAHQKILQYLRGFY